MKHPGIPLSFADHGKQQKVTDIRTGAGMQRRLADMGLMPGVEVTVISGCYPGPLVIEVKGSRLGLGFSVAQNVLVKEVVNAEKKACSCLGG